MDKLRVLNIGAPSFADELKQQDVDVMQVDWQPPAHGNPELLKALSVTDSEEINKANSLAIEQFLSASPYLVDYQLAKDVIPNMDKNTFLHAGPRLLGIKCVVLCKELLLPQLFWKKWQIMNKTQEKLQLLVL